MEDAITPRRIPQRTRLSTISKELYRYLETMRFSGGNIKRRTIYTSWYQNNSRVDSTTYSDECPTKLHILSLSEKISKTLELDERKKNYGNCLDCVTIKDNETIEGDRPINIAECLPNMKTVYANILEPYVTGDVQTRFLRAISLNTLEYKYGYTKVKGFLPVMY